ncbi:MarR family winged helix-turn-helix transcriptional regulator [Quisquiliibacterium transsilvanicum]|uniref:DNA-binding MarR family transcriptional regulator n=1 Tax=Quisquiliibacterium transsilvanicum TaxID=1549638 RepID=A0A7W8M9V4_9BURK|nr:MarR family transcriptional regulator [Quisquiliibacterium transsilvanicum]MBB5273416.1 DNA-binding MarR family transcriptional regulator [Quisquiliibacterium transsilvanicum]
MLPTDPSPSIEALADHETRLEAGDHTALKLWLRMMTCRDLIGGTLQRRLRSDFDTTSPRFELMAQLAQHPAGLKMSQLSQRLMVTGGNVTALADFLEAEGLIVRESVPDDRRAIRLRLTDAGRARFDTIAQEHERWVISLFGGLTRSEQHELHALLGKLKTSVTRCLGNGDAH